MSAPVPPATEEIDPFVAGAFLTACRAELTALKPGNVHVFAPGHRMTVGDFERSAEAAAPFVARRGVRIGQRIREAVTATRAAVGQNTNLGIVLLAAPIARAFEIAEGPGRGKLRAALGRVLDDLDIQDAIDGFAAIRLAEPGGLGSADRHDVSHQPSASFRDAMAEAAARDTIARAYVTGFADLFDPGLVSFERAVAQRGFGPAAITQLYFRFLAAFPDSHIVRKHGIVVAERVRQTAADLQPRLAAGDAAAELIALDRSWKAASINPGTSADLTVATIFLHLIGCDK